MALTDTFIRQIEHSGAPAGNKHTDGHGLFLLVTPAGKYWHLNYHFAGKQKTLALGAYHAVFLTKARKRRDEAREHRHGPAPPISKSDDAGRHRALLRS